MPRLRLGNAAWCPDILRALEVLQPDLVHLHWPFIGGIAPVLTWRRDPSLPSAGRRGKGSGERRLIIQYHMDLVGDGWRGAAFFAYQRCTLPRMLAVADRVVVSSLNYAQSGALKPYIEELRDRLVDIPLGVDADRFHPNTGYRTQNIGLRVLFVGGLDRAHAFKGLSVLLEAIALQKKGPGPFFLRVVGDGDLRATYEHQARELGIADHVEFLGSVSDAELPTTYHNADVLVLPSTSRSEAFGVVLLEAMASGLPVIASDLPGVRTVVEDGTTGFLVPPGDVGVLMERLRILASDPMLRQRMGDAARQRVLDQYTWDDVQGRWAALYQSCVSS